MDLVDFLSHKTIGEVAVMVPHLISAYTDTSALEGFQLIINHNISSIPLYDRQKLNYTCFLDVLDILYYLTNEKTDEIGPDKLKTITCGELADFSKLDPFISITDNTNLIKVLQLSSQNYRSLHRFPVVDSTGKLISTVSQSLLVRYLEPHTKKFDFGTLTVGVLGLGLDKNVITVSEDDSVLTAVQKLKQYKISGLGIVDRTGALVGEFDALGMKYFGFTHNDLSLVKAVMHDYLLQVRPHQSSDYPVYVTKATLSHQAIIKFIHYGLHRLFVTDDAKKPIGIISLVDIIELFFRHILIE